MMNFHDTTSHSPQDQGALSGEQSIQPDGAELLDILAAVLDYPPDALIVVDSAGTMVLVNTRVETLFGYNYDELIGQPIELLIPEHLRAAHSVQRAHYMQAPRSRPMGIGLDLMGQRKDGSRFPVDISLRPIRIRHTLHVIAAIRDMTAQREVERTRMQISQRLRQQDKLLNLANDAILVRDPENRIVSWNEGAKHLYGWTDEEAVGQVTYLLLQTRFPISRETVDHTLEEQGQWQGELTHTCRDRREVIVESRQALIRDEQGAPSAILEIDRDVTERRRLERLEQEARVEMKARLNTVQLILDEMPTGAILVRGFQGRLITANRAATNLWGAEWKQDQSMEDFLTQHGLRLFSADGRPISQSETATRHAVLTGEALHQCQQVIRRADGTSLPILVSTIPLDTLASSLHPSAAGASVPAPPERVVLIVYEDVTALKEAEALKDQFISLATHELRTPVTVIAGYTDMLLRRAVRGKEHGLDEWQSAKLQEMKQATEQLAKLTHDLLDVTRAQAGQFQLHLSPTDLVALTRQVVGRLQATTERHQLSLYTTLAHLWAQVDAERVEQVLSNLLDNAIKYSPQGGPIEVTLEENAAAREALFRICDHGMGIPHAQQVHIFGRFVRADNVRAARIGGTGLGLYLCRELVERHGGHISFESEEGVGSTFFFSLPLTESAQQEHGGALHGRADSASPSS